MPTVTPFNTRDVEKNPMDDTESPRPDLDEDGEQVYTAPAETAQDLVTEVIHARDDPTLNAWTFRTWFLGTFAPECYRTPKHILTLIGIGLATFAGILATIYFFKPQQVAISVVFLAVISYVLGQAMALAIPRKGIIGRIFNPHPVSRLPYGNNFIAVSLMFRSSTAKSTRPSSSWDLLPPPRLSQLRFLPSKSYSTTLPSMRPLVSSSSGLRNVSDTELLV